MNDFEKMLNKKDELAAKIRTLTVEATKRKINPFDYKFASQEYLDLVTEPVEELNSLLAELFTRELAQKGPENFSTENMWMWGGPTSLWGGTLDKNTSIKAAKEYGLENVIYVYGSLNEEMVALHQNCRSLICHLGSNCRAAGAQSCSDVEEAETLSRLSLKYRNIRGGVIDDMLVNYGLNYSRKDYRAIHAALKKHNPELELYSVVYAHDLNGTEVSKILSECVDHVILWVWERQDLLNLDLYIEKCLAAFPGKKIMLGVFMFDYGLAILPNTAEAVSFQLTKAKKYLTEGKIQSIVFLGDREIEKCPEADKVIRGFIQKELQAK